MSTNSNLHGEVYEHDLMSTPKTVRFICDPDVMPSQMRFGWVPWTTGTQIFKGNYQGDFKVINVVSDVPHPTHSEYSGSPWRLIVAEIKKV